MIINNELRVQSVCRRFKYELLKSIGILRFLNSINFISIKEPFKKMYNRDLRQKIIINNE